MRHIALLCPGRRRGAVQGYTVGRIGRLLSAEPDVMCLAVAPDDFVVSAGGVSLRGGLCFEGTDTGERCFEPPLVPDFVYYGYDPDPVRDVAARELLISIAEHGVRTNYDPDATQLGVKSILEERCREYEESSGRRIPRPRTLVVDGDRDKESIVEFLRKFGPCIIKPHNLSRSRGVAILSSEDDVGQLELGSMCHVVQELVDRPLLMGGCKTGLRVYLIVHDLKRSYSLSQVGLVKVAPEPYRLGDPVAEIIGPYEQRDGSWPPIYLLNELVASDDTRSAWESIRRSIDQTIDLFMESVSWRAGLFHQRVPTTQIWGIDILVRESEGADEAILIEVNTFPQLYRGDTITDAAVDTVLRDEVFAPFP